MPFKCLDQDFQKVCGLLYILKLTHNQKVADSPCPITKNMHVSALSLQSEYQKTPFNEFARLQHQEKQLTSNFLILLLEFG